MQREARTEREWGQGPGRRTADQGGRDRLKALFTPSGGPEDHLPSNGDDVDYAALAVVQLVVGPARATTGL